MGRQGGKADDARRTRRQAQYDRAVHFEAESEGKLDDLRIQRKTHQLLVSVTGGLYDEVDKVNKKAPAEEITVLVCDEINQIIIDTKALAAEDTYVQRLKVFVPAGENPQNRDAVVVLRLVLKGLERFGQELDANTGAERSRLDSIRTVEAALSISLQAERDYASKEDLAAHMEAAPADRWLTGEYVSRHFDFEKLDRAELLDEWFGDPPNSGEAASEEKSQDKVPDGEDVE